jgi:hypothetical protein
MKMPEDAPKYGTKHIVVMKQNQCEQLDWFILKYLLCWLPEYHKWNLKVHYRVHKNLLMVPNLSQINPVHTTPSYFSKSHLRLSLLVVFFLIIPTKTLCAFLFSPCALHALPISSFLTWSLYLAKSNIY